MRYNRIAVKDAITGKLLPHYSVKDPSCKMRDIGVKEMFRKSIRMTFVRKFIYQPEVSLRHGRDIQR